MLMKLGGKLHFQKQTDSFLFCLIRSQSILEFLVGLVFDLEERLQMIQILTRCLQLFPLPLLLPLIFLVPPLKLFISILELLLPLSEPVLIELPLSLCLVLIALDLVTQTRQDRVQQLMIVVSDLGYLLLNDIVLCFEAVNHGLFLLK